MYPKQELENAVVAACNAAASESGLSGLQQAKFVVSATEHIVAAINALPVLALPPTFPAGVRTPAPRKPRGPNKPKAAAPAAAAVPAAPVPVPPAPAPAAPAAPALPFGS